MQKRGYEHCKAQKKAKERDGYVCQICGSFENVEGHHLLDYQYGGSFKLDNIVTLCRKCHKKVHKGEIDLIKF